MHPDAPARLSNLKPGRPQAAENEISADDVLSLSPGVTLTLAEDALVMSGMSRPHHYWLGWCSLLTGNSIYRSVGDQAQSLMSFLPASFR
jgi:hypothetical protein